MQNSYSHKLRVRSCGLLIEKGELLLVELLSPVTKKWIWIPPGGGVEFGESLEEGLVREFKEETGLWVSVQERIHVNEIIQTPIHAIEFYYLVQRKSGTLKLGIDPELDSDDQILRNIGFYPKEEIERMEVAPEFVKSELWSIIK